MKIMSFKNWLGFALILLALAIVITAKMYQGQIGIAIWLYVATIVLFGFGFPMALDMSFRSLIGLKEKPSYIYRPERQQILVRFGSDPFTIERDGLKVRLVMTPGTINSEKFMFVCEPDVGLDFAFRATGVDGGKELTLRGESRLYFVRQEPVGIKVWWSEANKPWKIVKEEE